MFSCSPLRSHHAPAPGFSSRVVRAAAAAVVPHIPCWLAHSCPPSYSLASLALPCDRCKTLTCALRPETVPFRCGLSTFAGASSAAATEGIRRRRRPRAPPADGGDVGASLPWAVCARWRVRVVGGCRTRVCVSGTHAPASCEQPSSHTSWGLLCIALVSGCAHAWLVLCMIVVGL